MDKKNCFSISTFKQLDNIIKKRKQLNNTTIILIKNFLIKGLGIDWLKTMIVLINKKHKNHKIFFYVDCGYDYGLSQMLIKEKIEYIKLKSNKVIINKINQIAKKNNVLLNPDFNVVELSNIKKITNKK